MEYIVEMLNITKEFPGIIANDNITLQLKKGEIHALLGENGAGKSTLMSVLFGMYQPENGIIKKNGEKVKINNPKDANNLGIGMVHQHFKLVHNFTVLQNIILGVETSKHGILQMKEARERVIELSQKYGLMVDPNAIIEDITVGMQQRVEILKMLYRENEILIFDEPTAVLTPQEIEELMKIMKNLAREGKSILFITHKLNEIKSVADRCTVLRKGKYIETVKVDSISKEKLSELMVGRKVSFDIDKKDVELGKVSLKVENLCVNSKNKDKKSVNEVSFNVRQGEIVCIAGIDGNGQSELVYALTGLGPIDRGKIFLSDIDITNYPVRKRNMLGMAHIPEDRHKDGLILDYTLEQNLILKRYFYSEYQNKGFTRFDAVREYVEMLIDKYDIRSGQGVKTSSRSMSGGNQQKAIIAREVDMDPEILIAVQPTRGLDVGAIEYIHKQLIDERDRGKAILLISLELDEVMNLSDRILVIHEGQIVGDLNPKEVTIQELGLYMAGSKVQIERGVGSNE
ncbi:MAG: ABC transporter ATP-binding protein [Terrisporobacter sp.]